MTLVINSTRENSQADLVDPEQPSVHLLLSLFLVLLYRPCHLLILVFPPSLPFLSNLVVLQLLDDNASVNLLRYLSHYF